MVIDSSALIAILLGESDASKIAEAIDASDTCFVSAATLLEAYIVIFNRKKEAGVKDLEKLIRKIGIITEGFHEHLLALARDAYMRFGKGSGHKAGLNFGDCSSYALARHRNDDCCARARILSTPT